MSGEVFSRESSTISPPVEATGPEPEPVRTSSEPEKLPATLRNVAIGRQEGYAALSGKAIQAGVYTTPPEVLLAATKDESADPIVDPKPGQQVATRPDDQQIGAIKAEVIQLYMEGRDVGSIAKKLGILESWVRKVCKDIPPIGVPVRNSPASPDSSPKDDPAPLTEAEIDSELIRLRDTGMSPKEIRDAMLLRGVDFGLTELRDRLSALARKAMQDRKDARQASEPEIPPNCNRAELDAVMWRLWDHGQGKTPDEISDILCNIGYSYGTAAVERRLRQQGADL